MLIHGKVRCVIRTVQTIKVKTTGILESQAVTPEIILPWMSLTDALTIAGSGVSKFAYISPESIQRERQKENGLDIFLNQCILNSHAPPLSFSLPLDPNPQPQPSCCNRSPAAAPLPSPVDPTDHPLLTSLSPLIAASQAPIPAGICREHTASSR